MQKIKLLIKLTLIGSSFLLNSAYAAEASKLKDQKFIDDVSYSVGVSFGLYLNDSLDSGSQYINYNRQQVLAGIKAAANNESIDQQAIEKTLIDFRQEIEQVQAAEFKALAADNAAKGSEFRNQYAKGKDVKSTKSGILYKIVKPGDGKAPVAADVVKVQYQGTFIDGVEFDSSYARNMPAEFGLQGVIPGWTEALQLISKGGEIEFVLPPELGYGESGTGNILPNSTLIFKVELLDINPSK